MVKLCKAPKIEGYTAMRTYFFLKHQSKLLHDVFSEEDGQELVVGDVLDLGDVDAPGFLVEGLIIPVRVHFGQSVGDTVVLSSH